MQVSSAYCRRFTWWLELERLYPKSIRVWRVSTRVLMTVYHNRQRVSLVDPDLKGDGWCNPVLCDDFPSKVRVERLAAWNWGGS